MRNQSNYQEHLLLNDPKLTGLKSNCVFNELKFFKVYNNFVADIMHDLYEGVARYDLPMILNYFIKDKKYLDLETLNLLKQNFDYGEIEVGNLSKEITEGHLKNKCLNFSASETKTLLTFLPLMIGHKIPENDKLWKLLCTLVTISDQLMKSEFTTRELSNLENLIKSYLKKHVEIFGANLKPKHHFMVHYCSIIRMNGPLRHMMCFVFEQKNREVKAYSKVSHQRINLPKSLCYKISMKINKFLETHKNGFLPITSHSNFTIRLLSLWKQKPFFELVNLKINLEENFNNVKCMKFIHHKNKKMKVGYFMIQEKSETFTLYKIVDIFYFDEYHVVVEKYRIKYNEKILCYIVESSENKFEILYVESFKHPPLNLHTLVTGEIVFRVKYV